MPISFTLSGIETLKALSQVENVVILPIYPAREEPIPGVSSGLILEGLTSPHKILCQKEELVQELEAFVKRQENDIVVLTLGAGDIDRLLPALQTALKQFDNSSKVTTNSSNTDKQ